ncbi:serine/threonine protein kinase [Rhodoferax sp.]|uniref:serine/threonine protein kinase n=1 Tax=Rhodoferax sp. TaxID=50421 RepID=UPI0025D087C2|nr:serine/threonine protein kinase [Rhodoferax sp.]
MTHPTAHGAAHPFETLTPDVVLDALDSVGLRGDGRLTALSSYENRVYQVQLEDGAPVVAKFYRPERWSKAQIQEEHDFAAELMADDIPAVGPLVFQGHSLHEFEGFSFSVSPRRGGRPPELDDGEVLEWIGRFLARIHTVGARAPFVHRPALDVQTFAAEPMEWLLSHDMVPLDVQTLWSKRCQEAIDLIAGRADMERARGQNKTNSSGIRHLRLHGDCHPGNILWTPTDVAASAGPGPHFVDLDDARTGPAVQDLWMLLSGDRQQQTRQLGMLVDGYEQFREFDRMELALIEPLRTLRLIHYSAWLARRWSDPIFPVNFPWFGTSDYWKGQIQMLEDQIEAMNDAPLIV